MKRLILSMSVAVFLIVVFLVWAVKAIKPASSDTSLKDFLIVKGTSASQIGDKLQKEGLIRSSLAFKIYVQVTASQRRIQAGEYGLSPSYSLFKVVEELVKGPQELWVTIPEGYRREEIAEKFTETLGKDETFIEEFIDKSSGLEGFLFPDTYLFPKTVNAEAVVKKMKSTFDLRVDKKMQEDIKMTGYNVDQIITMGSMVERETITDKERPIVAGILFKRLKAGWALQVDAALQYAVASQKCKGVLRNCEWWSTLTKEDLQIPSRYNTYKYSGLPPTPIANPGLSSIRAALFPEESEYWFYLHDSKGQIHYAKTIEEHNENVSKYLGK